MLNIFRSRTGRSVTKLAGEATRRTSLRRRMPLCEMLEQRLNLSTFTVSLAGDPFTGSNPTAHTLRWAIQQANATPGSTVNFAIDDSVLVKPHGPLTITAPTTIDATGHTVTINGGGASSGVQDFVITKSNNVNFIGDASKAFAITAGHSTGDGGAIYASDPNAVVTLNNVSVTSSQANGNGGGVYSAGSLSLLNSSVVGDRANGNGGGVYSARSLVISSSILTNDTATNNGGGAYIGNNSSPVVVTNSLFQHDNASRGSGGGLWANFNVTATSTAPAGAQPVAPTTFSNNTAGTNGGGIYSNLGNVTLNDVVLTSNRAAAGSGGAVWAKNNIQAQAGTYVDGNTAFLNGGGLYSQRGQVYVTDSTVGDQLGNQALNGYGGGIWTGGNANILFSNVDSNTAQEDGGGIYALGNINLTESLVSGNSTSGNGGGLAVGGSSSSSTISIIGSSVDSNSAIGDGGGVYQPAGNIYTLDSSISNNIAAEGQGGGLYDGSGSINLDADTTIDSNVASSGGGIFIGAGGVLTTLDPSSSSVSLPPSTFDGLQGLIQITNNQATSTDTGGGGILADGADSVTLHNTLVAGNTADSDGGGALMHNVGNIDIGYSTFVSNTSFSGNGGGLAVIADSSAEVPSSIHIDDSTFGADLNVTPGGQSAGLNGGGVYLSGVDADFNHVTFNDNTVNSGGAGAAIFADALTSLYLENTLIEDTDGLVPPGVNLIDGNPASNIISMGHNLTSDNSLAAATNYLPSNGDITGQTQALLPLANSTLGTAPTYDLADTTGPANNGADPLGPFVNQDGNARPPHNIGSV